MRVYRIADGRYPLLDGMGAYLLGARWNSPGTRVVYGSLSYACAMLEIFVHLGGDRLPRHFVDVTLDLPDDLAAETAALPDGWREKPHLTADLGDEWVASGRTVALLVPSAVAKNETNVLLNPLHQDFNRVVASQPSQVSWDDRLFT